MMMIFVIDLCDMYEDKLVYGSLCVFMLVFCSFGKCVVFVGLVFMFKVFEDNGLVCVVLEEQGVGCVLVIDGGGLLCCVLVGGNFGKLVEENGWEGILFNGCVCDMCELVECNVGIYVLVVYLCKSIKKNVGQCEVGVQMLGVYIQFGEWVYVDEDGVLVLQDMLE